MFIYITMNIDRNKLYTFRGYSYKNFINLSDAELLTILAWRNHEAIRMCMNNTEIISVDSHLKYCRNLVNRTDVCYWMILKDEKPIGVLNIIDIDYENGICEPGFYLSPKVMGRGESIFVLSNYKDFLLNELDFNGLIGHNYKDNKHSIIFTMFFGAEITGVTEVDGRVSIKSFLSKENFRNGVGTERLILKYTHFLKIWDTEQAIKTFQDGE